jgi:hypothetical protein
MTWAIYFAFVAVLIVLAAIDQPKLQFVLPAGLVDSYALLVLIALFLGVSTANRNLACPKCIERN